MKRLFLLTLSALFFFKLSAQKKPITNSATITWPIINGGLISPDGNFATYTISNHPVGGATSILTATNKSWQRSFKLLNDTKFTSDSRYFIAQSADTLLKLNLKSKLTTVIPNCSENRIITTGAEEWLVYHLTDSLKTLKLENLNSGKTYDFTLVESYMFNSLGNILLLKSKTEDKLGEKLTVYDLDKRASYSLYTGKTTADVIFDRKGNQIAFTVRENDQKHIYCYDLIKKSLNDLSINISKATPANLSFSTAFIWKFTEDGKRLLFNFEPTLPEKSGTDPGMTIWNYRDAYLPQQYKKMKAVLERGRNLSAIDIPSGKIFRLLSGIQAVNSEYRGMDVVFAVSTNGWRGDVPWNKDLTIQSYLCFTNTGRIDTLPAAITATGSNQPYMTPDGRFLVYYNYELKQYESYDVASKKATIISRGIDEAFTEYYLLNPSKGAVIGEVTGWFTDLKRVIIQCRYNLWSVDPTGQSMPVNLTGKAQNGYPLVFSPRTKDLKISSKEDVELSSYNFDTKETGLYKWNFNKAVYRELFRTNNYTSDPYVSILDRFEKASKADKYMFLADNVQHSPNYVFTADFKTYDTLSNVYPEKEYNWMSSEIIRYKDKLGRDCEAILYKPENFSETERYPVIFDYYTIHTIKYNKYYNPEPDGSGVNIPLLVSRGYLVVKPNIYPIYGNPGEAALISVTAAADHLSHFKWVDSTRMAITGHSYGGYETNYLVTHSQRFAAAVSGAGFTNIVDGVAGNWGGNNGPSFGYYVHGPYQMQKSLHEDVAGYVKNSPLMSTASMTTPLLLIHNVQDPAVPAVQSEQFFIQLRHEGKPVWLLQYDGERHFLRTNENNLDLQKRVTDFFDHYLKGGKEPDWMLNHN